MRCVRSYANMFTFLFRVLHTTRMRRSSSINSSCGCSTSIMDWSCASWEWTEPGIMGLETEGLEEMRVDCRGFELGLVGEVTR